MLQNVKHCAKKIIAVRYAQHNIFTCCFLDIEICTRFDFLKFQFFTYNAQTKGCGLRHFIPNGRSFSLGNVSGLKNESPSLWSQVSNSVYVAKSLKTDSAEDCQAVCLADNDCKAMIFNELLGHCSLSYGTGPYRTIPLGSQDKFGISSCLKQRRP